MEEMGLIPSPLVSAVAHCVMCGKFTELTDDGACYRCSDLTTEVLWQEYCQGDG